MKCDVCGFDPCEPASDDHAVLSQHTRIRELEAALGEALGGYERFVHSWERQVDPGAPWIQSTKARIDELRKLLEKP